MKRFLMAVSMVALIAPTSARAAITVIPDGGFESPQIGANSYVYTPGNTLWTFTGNSGEINGTTAFGSTTAPEGNQVAFLQSGTGQTTGVITQTFSLAAGTYSLVLSAEARSNFGNPAASFSITLNGASIGSDSPLTGSFGTYTSSTFTTTGAPVTLTFTATGPGDSTAFIDNLYLNNLTVVPEPASVAMLAMGLVAVGGFAAKKSRRNRN